MARIKDITFDTPHPAPIARFWAAALDGYAVAPYDEAELERLRQLGIDSTEDDPTVVVEAGPGRARLLFQLVPEEKVTKNRVHLDLAIDSPDEQGFQAELDRLTGLGAVLQADHQQWVILTDPDGNEFCLTKH
ncbi:MAG TPA: VOC family protein [Streptosporangiaceae bacterium]